MQVPDFTLPPNPRAPLVLVGAGSGIGPLRGFLQHRLAIRRNSPGAPLGPCLLFYGCRAPDEFVCREEILSAKQAGVLTEFKIAYSRASPLFPKQYVQVRTPCSSKQCLSVWASCCRPKILIACNSLVLNLSK